MARLFATGALILGGCGDSSASVTEDVTASDATEAPDTDAAPVEVEDPDAHENDTAQTDVRSDVPPETTTVRVVTFNVGSGGSPANAEDNLGFGPRESDISDEWFGNGLAFASIVEETRSYLAAVEPDIVAFQEIFWSGDCPTIPEELYPGFVCETWEEGEPTVANLLLGPDWHVVCHPGKPDKCIGVRSAFGRLEGCQDILCLDGLEGSSIEGCGRGARAAGGTIELASGGSLRIVNVHGNSGFGRDETGCRVAQVQQVFAGSDGQPAITRDFPTIVLGDLNTDPGRLAGSDPSAAAWMEEPAEHGFAFISDVGEDAEPSYVLLNIDHVLARGAEGTCRIGGPVVDATHFDHRPIECELAVPR